MARSINTDPFHNFRFHVIDPSGGNLDPVAGFTQAALPDITVDAQEYREGVFKFTQKYPGIPTISEVQLMKGIFIKDSDFFRWILKTINGGEDYRTDLVIQQYHISDEFGINGTPSRITRLKEVFPTTVKPTADLDATGSEVSIQECTLAVEEIEIEIVQQ